MCFICIYLPHFECFREKVRFEYRLRDLDSKKAQHTEVCEHFFESRSLKMRQIWLFGERGEWLLLFM